MFVSGGFSLDEPPPVETLYSPLLQAWYPPIVQRFYPPEVLAWYRSWVMVRGRGVMTVVPDILA
jgi:hypothetical protein